MDIKNNEDLEFENEEMEENEDLGEIKSEEELDKEESEEEKLDDEVINNELSVSDDSDNLNIIIEVSSDEKVDINHIVDIEPDDILKTDEIESDEIILSKHKLQGKHSLKYDSIFKGKKDDKLDEDDPSLMILSNENFDIDKSSPFYVESSDTERYLRNKIVKEKVYKILSDYTGINFLNNRRKPSKHDFNQYYQLLIVHLKDESFTNVELFNELSVYFSDNLFNMFKLLDNKWRNLIISELQDHIGKNANSKEITNKNISIGTEVEFIHKDALDEVKLYTGVIIETDYDNSIFKIDSYENIYEIEIKSISKILNNTKFKYNLNKLNNIDFL